mmetsp:Transcript_18201/g.31007  ORF Transcript_18201/g.31007 Transcript_18201/m.31007 type:complete len:137 (-) Transcript_18201:2168-2578(-)
MPLKSDTKKRKLRFRNYTPNDASLAAVASSPENNDPSNQQVKKKKLLDNAKMLVSELESKVRAVVENVDTVKATPKKINWDLKRDASKRLAKLARRTQRAILELAKEEQKRREEEEGSESEGDSDASSSGESDSDN